MNDAVSAFLFITVIAMVFMAILTRSIGGAFLGLALVAVGTSLFLFNQGGLSTIGGVAFGGLAFLALVLTFMLGINLSYSTGARYHPDGTIDRVSHTVIGDGARQSYTRFHTPQLSGGGVQEALGDGKEQ